MDIMVPTGHYTTECSNLIKGNGPDTTIKYKFRWRTYVKISKMQ